MATFKYRAKEGTGNTVEGVIEALTSEEAVEKISQIGYIPVRVEEMTSKPPATRPKNQTAKPVAESPSRPSPSSVSIGKIGLREITAFGRQMSSLLRAGVPILRAIGIVAEQSENPHFKKLLDQIFEEVKNGAPFSVALSRYPKLFSPLYLALVSAGEASGTLDQTLLKITDYRQKQEEFVSRLRSAMIYPILMLVTGMGTIVFMLTFVMPRLMGVFSNLGGDLPLPTKILIQTSDLMREGWFLALAAFLAAFLLLGGRSLKKGNNKVLGRLVLGIPVFGPLILKSEIARFSRTMELLIKSGVQIIHAIENAAPVVGNTVLRESLVGCVQDLKEGGSFGKSLKQTKRFPSLMTNLITVGEEAGKLDEALGELAVFYERETDEALRTMTSLLEPVMILFMGLVVGFIVIAMLLPMFELNMMVK